jgi:hypothetical protein
VPRSPPAALVRLFGATVAPLQFVDRQRWLQTEVSSHVHMLQPPTTT